MNNKSYQHVSVAAAVAAILGGIAMSGYAPAARAADEAGALEEVTVTGSRIVRKDLVSNSPLVTVETKDLENKSGLNIENYLNQLPEYNPAASPVTTQQDVQISAVNSVGISSISLRGFGPNRSLVLVDGHRPTPINALMVTDINGIPSAMIKRVEIISGGASAVYGADAIGGVTNFILRDDFQGLELDLQRGATEVHDGDETRAAAIMGTNVAEGRGNITMGAEFYDRKQALRAARDFYTNAWSDPWTPTADLFVFGYNGYNTGFNAPNATALNTTFPERVASGGGVFAPGPGFVSGLRFNSDGSLFDLSGDINTSHYKGPTNTGQYALQNTYDTTRAARGVPVQTLKWNNPIGLLSAPQTRYSFFGSGKWDFTDNLAFFARGTYAESKTETRLIPTNASFGWEAQVPYNPTTDSPYRLTDPNNPSRLLDYGSATDLAAIRANPTLYANPTFIAHGAAGAQHPISPEMAILLNSRGRFIYCLSGAPGCAPANATPNPALVGTAGFNANRAASWIAETFPNGSFPQRSTVNTNNVWQVETGFRFNLPVKDWTGDLYYSHGQSSTYNIAYGNNSLTRWRALVSAPDYGRNSNSFGNANGASPNFGTVPVPCTSGFYETLFMGDAVPSADCQYAAEATLQTRTQNQQDIAELNFQGGLFNLPAGEVRGALGYQYRKNQAQFFPDILQSTASFADQVIGVYPTGPLDASTNAKDVYGELLVPIVSDVPFLKKVELELGGRQSEYSTTDSTFTFKINGNIELNDWVRFRGGYNRATRAPNLGELFLNLQEIFTGDGRFGDPCGVRSNSPFGAGGSGTDPNPQITTPTQLAAGQTAAGAQSTKLICQQQMGLAAATQFYTNANAPGAGGGVFAWVYQQGNKNLKSEKADTWTAGMVFTSRAENRLLAGFTAAVDWWKVDISNAIQQYSIDYARYLCYGAVTVTTAAEAAAQAATPGCQNVPRNLASGGPTTMLLKYDNQATIATSGVDVQVNWGAGLADLGLGKLPGRVGMNVQASWLDAYKTKQSPFSFDAETDWKGSLGPTLTGTNAGAYAYRLNMGLSYSLPTVNVSLRWRHLPSVTPAAAAAQRAIVENNNRVANGGPGVMVSYTPGTWIAAPKYDVFDLSGVWNVNQMLSVRAGVDNVLNRFPSITGATKGYPAGTDLTTVCGGAVARGCVNPTNYSVPNSGFGTTSAGYYDVLGRRYYLGLKATF
jgi:outer membrane receptor for ferrienterochelin and colicin